MTNGDEANAAAADNIKDRINGLLIFVLSFQRSLLVLALESVLCFAEISETSKTSGIESASFTTWFRDFSSGAWHTLTSLATAAPG